MLFSLFYLVSSEVSFTCSLLPFSLSLSLSLSSPWLKYNISKWPSHVNHCCIWYVMCNVVEREKEWGKILFIEMLPNKIHGLAFLRCNFFVTSNIYWIIQNIVLSIALSVSSIGISNNVTFGALDLFWRFCLVLPNQFLTSLRSYQPLQFTSTYPKMKVKVVLKHLLTNKSSMVLWICVAFRSQSVSDWGKEWIKELVCI